LGSDPFGKVDRTGDFSEQRFGNIVKRNRYWQELAKKRRIKDDNKLVTEAKGVRPDIDTRNKHDKLTA